MQLKQGTIYSFKLESTDDSVLSVFYRFNFIVIKTKILRKEGFKMTIECKVDVIQSLDVRLKFDDDTSKHRIISKGDLIDITWNGNGARKHMIGRVSTVSCHGSNPASWYIIVDGADDFDSRIEKIAATQILDVDIIRKGSEDRLVATPKGDGTCPFIRINHGRLQYSIDGLNWKYVKIDNTDIIEEQEGTVPLFPPNPGRPPMPPYDGDGIEDAVY